MNIIVSLGCTEIGIRPAHLELIDAVVHLWARAVCLWERWLAGNSHGEADIVLV